MLIYISLFLILLFCVWMQVVELVWQALQNIPLSELQPCSLYVWCVGGRATGKP